MDTDVGTVTADVPPLDDEIDELCQQELNKVLVKFDRKLQPRISFAGGEFYYDILIVKAKAVVERKHEETCDPRLSNLKIG